MLSFYGKAFLIALIVLVVVVASVWHEVGPDRGLAAAIIGAVCYLTSLGLAVAWNALGNRVNGYPRRFPLFTDPRDRS